ncbi:MAG: hypothetical protein H7X80_03360 [bacterium]|nr:hypothetical protein [Candidatus Kapabacteria bacterium]
MRFLILLAIALVPTACAIQPKIIAPRQATRIVAVEEAIRAGIDRERIDSVYIDGSGDRCMTCRFDAGKRDAYDEQWNAFLGELMQGMLEHDVQFSELIVRAYFSADGYLDYMLYHVGGSTANNEGFIAAATKVSNSFRFAIPADGPFKQSSTIALGPAFEGE